ncbi:J domain-containing protein [Geomesophilobacter sediminis]|uniref:J domain-containing protein n=1 Tax=Geomesophilobacter sediminis TaxID=2798584 RepID=A0A8J7ISL8_9BACT|nr:J domain-containing protein [Geomesophilobacter sediminis]MBJ6726319.1 J domain-containing protein [Geomesophilobacter sediminis]
MLAPPPETQLLAACRALFGPEVEVSRDFLRYLQPSGAKAAFRSMAKKTHPDLHRREAAEVKGDQFRRLVEAYELMLSYFEQRENGSALPPRPSPADYGNGEYYHQGDLPQRHLELGRYLFYRGLIPYRALIEAVTWQRRQRPTIGTLARRWNWLSEHGVRSVLGTTTLAGKFGDKAVVLGLLSRFQVRQLLYHQRSLQAKFGQFFVERGYFTPRELELLLIEQSDHNRRFTATPFP